MLLNEEQIAHWEDHGWLLISHGLDDQTLSSAAREVKKLSLPGEHNCQALHYYEDTDRGPVLCRTERFLSDSEFLAILINTGLVPELASQLLGEPAILFKEKVNYKHALGAGFSAHQDASAYDYINHHVTCLIPLDEMTMENGCLEFAPVSKGILLGTNDQGCIEPSLARSFNWQPLLAKPGDLIYFDSYTPHRSGPNRTESPRRAIYLTFNAASESDMRSRYYENRQESMKFAGGRISTIGHFQGVYADPPEPRKTS